MSHDRIQNNACARSKKFRQVLEGFGKLLSRRFPRKKYKEKFE
jgi:hypothetical protein